MATSSECTILIPTHNRAGYLSRCVRWFSDFGCPIVIADSSVDISCGGLQSARIKHIHCPGGFEAYFRKLSLALENIETPFVAMCADDDFITKEGLEASVSFLQAHEDYVFSQGYAYLYQSFRTRIVLWPMVYLFHNNESDDWVTRVEQAKSTIFYGVNRTEVLRDAIAFISAQDFTDVGDGIAGFVDTALTTCVARAGKFKRCDTPFAFREYSTSVNTVGRRFDAIISRNLPDFYGNLMSRLLGDETDPIKRQRLVRLFAADFAGQIVYDLGDLPGRKERLQSLPDKVRRYAEYLFRLYRAGVLFKSKQFRPFLKVFLSPGYLRFRTYVLGSEQQ